MRELLQEEDKAAAPAAVGSQKKSGKTQEDDADRVMRELSIRHSNGPE
jgi:hypothetical protein